MATILHKLSFTLLLLPLFFVQSTLSADPLESSPSPAPELSTGPLSPPPDAGAPSSPSPSPQLNSPPAPPPSNPAPSSSPTPAPEPSSSNSSSPAPAVASDVNHANDVNAQGGKESSGGKSGGQKAGIAFGVIAGVCVVIFGGVLYKKRQDNIRRSQYGYGARREIL